MGVNHARVFGTLAETELVAVCDIDEGRAAKMREATGAAQAYTDYRKLLAEAPVDAISIATPDFTHTPIILAGLAAGKHTSRARVAIKVLPEALASDRSA